MPRIEKSIFISYRRTNGPWALAVYQDLIAHDYDVFFDYQSIDAGSFADIILNNIASRAHFVLLLTPSALERCAQPGDWLRREIEYAIEMRRNIVPLMLEGFDFGCPAIARALTGRLAALKDYNALEVPMSYFPEAMDRLRERFLSVPVEAVIHPRSTQAAGAAEEQRAAASGATVDAATLDEQVTFERRYQAEDERQDAAVQRYSALIAAQPDAVDAYIARGHAYMALGNYHRALTDYSEAIRRQPDSAAAYGGRAEVYNLLGQYDEALADIAAALRLAADDARHHVIRGEIHLALGDYRAALADFDTALQIDPSGENARKNADLVRQMIGG